MTEYQRYEKRKCEDHLSKMRIFVVLMCLFVYFLEINLMDLFPNRTIDSSHSKLKYNISMDICHTNDIHIIHMVIHSNTFVGENAI